MNTDRFKFRAWIHVMEEMVYSVEFDVLSHFFSYLDVEFSHGDYDLMQSTGLKDVEGTLIYESDIVQYERGLPDPVTGLLEVVICPIEWRNRGFYIPTFDFNLKIIGNIYETVQE